MSITAHLSRDGSRIVQLVDGPFDGEQMPIHNAFLSLSLDSRSRTCQFSCEPFGAFRPSLANYTRMSPDRFIYVWPEDAAVGPQS